MSPEDTGSIDATDPSAVEGDPPTRHLPAGEPDPAYRRSNIGRLLLRAFEHFEGRIERGLHELGFVDFGPADARILRHLDLDGTRITVLAERARITKQAVSQTVQDLEGRGLVRRVADPDDGRAKLVRLTGRGRRLIACGQEVNRQLVAEWQEAIGEDGVVQLRDLLEQLLSALAALSPDDRDPETS